jgi:hypothetical protein
LESNALALETGKNRYFGASALETGKNRYFGVQSFSFVRKKKQQAFLQKTLASTPNLRPFFQHVIQA